MGVSTNATIFYGILLDSEEGKDYFGSEGYCDCPMHDIDDVEEEYAKKKGWVENNGGLFNEAGEYALDKESPEGKKAEKICHKNWRAKSKITDDCPVELGYHCSGDYPMHYVGIKESLIMARRGYPVEIDATDLSIEADWVDKLKDYCKTMGIKYEKPGWHLVSYWG